MDSRAKIYLNRAENKILLAKTNFTISTDDRARKLLNIPKDQTFFNDVISQCYYSIFYAAKAFLLEKHRIETKAPEEHKKVQDHLLDLTLSGRLDRQLFEIYNTEAEKASVLLKIFAGERSKRSRFTYEVNSNANIPHAEESLNNARKFVSVLKGVIEA